MNAICSTIRRLTLPGLALAVLVLVAGGVRADGVIGYRNDTSHVILIQSQAGFRKSKPIMLAPSEIALDTLHVAGTRKIVIVDPKKTSVEYYSGTVTLARGADQFLSIRMDSSTVMIKNQLKPMKMKIVESEFPPNMQPPNRGLPGRPNKP